MSTDIPQRLGKYDVIREINRGSMGTVYLGHDPYADRPVAIKVAHAEQLKDEESGDRYRKMFFNEAHTAGRLTHPNIISIFDAGVDGEICYIIMEYVEGDHTLKPYCKADSLLPIEKVVEISFKCARALDYAYKQGVIHRDIKPTNILVTQDMDTKIGDFSIAHLTKMDSTETMPMGLVGSPRYMSPEQVSEDYLTHQTDIFSFGIVMYELLCGKHPFAADNFSRLVQKILNDTPPALSEFRSGIDPALERIVSKALAKDRAQRYQMGGGTRDRSQCCVRANSRSAARGHFRTREVSCGQATGIFPRIPRCRNVGNRQGWELAGVSGRRRDNPGGRPR
ncbi:MAG: serine/threonine protein kinase [Gammaproteobacteria bacterium]|nr:serine/threonine protein kinase [Gammaproteobacteria bacterium]